MTCTSSITVCLLKVRFPHGGVNRIPEQQESNPEVFSFMQNGFV